MGFGGSVGFADPRARISFGYAMTRIGPRPRSQRAGESLVDAVYRSLGYRQPSGGGAWYR